MPDAQVQAGDAVLVVDMQVDFGLPEGSLYVRGAEEILEVVNGYVRAARVAGAPVVYTQDWHPPATPHFAKDGGLWPVHCVQDSTGAGFLPGLDVAGPVVRKGAGQLDGYSGFSVRHPVSGERQATELDDLLRAHGVRHLLVVGLAGDYCVKETALDGVRLGYRVSVPLEATRFVNLEPWHEGAAIRDMRAAGVNVT